MKIYTKTGDQGTTSLIGGERVSKDDLRVQAYGNIDELMAHLAYLRDSMDPIDTSLEEFRDDLMVIMRALMKASAAIAVSVTGTSKDTSTIDDGDISYVEDRIDYITLQLRPVDKFTIPGGHQLVSWTHICRTVCRRAERLVVRAGGEYAVPENVVIYLNRLSDYLYQLGRRLAEILEVEEVFWNP